MAHRRAREPARAQRLAGRFDVRAGAIDDDARANDAHAHLHVIPRRVAHAVAARDVHVVDVPLVADRAERASVWVRKGPRAADSPAEPAAEAGRGW